MESKAANTDTLGEALPKIRKAFEDWRYLYERPKSELPIGALWRFARMLFRFVVEQCPDLALPAD